MLYSIEERTARRPHFVRPPGSRAANNESLEGQDKTAPAIRFATRMGSRANIKPTVSPYSNAQECPQQGISAPGLFVLFVKSSPACCPHR